MCLLLLVRVSPAATPYTSPGGSFGFTLPDGWQQIPHDQVQETLNTIRKADAPSRQASRMEAMFQSPGREPFEYPYVGVQVTPYPVPRQPNESDIQEMLKAARSINVDQAITREMTPEAQAVMSGGSIGKFEYDQDTKTFRMPLTMNVEGRPVRGVGLGYFGKREMVMVMFYAEAEDFDRHQPEIQQIASSFRFTQSAAYDHNAASLSRSRRIGQVVGGGVVLLAVVGVVIGLVWQARRKAATAAMASPYYPPGTGTYGGYAPPYGGQYGQQSWPPAAGSGEPPPPTDPPAGGWPPGR